MSASATTTYAETTTRGIRFNYMRTYMRVIQAQSALPFVAQSEVEVLAQHYAASKRRKCTRAQTRFSSHLGILFLILFLSMSPNSCSAFSPKSKSELKSAVNTCLSESPTGNCQTAQNMPKSRSFSCVAENRTDMDNVKEPLSIYFVRHSESEENIRVAAWRKTFRGQKPDLSFGDMLKVIKPSMRDASITDRGHKMIDTVKQKLTQSHFFERTKIDAWLCSPLQRTVQTCNGLWSDCDIEQHACLLEKQPHEFVFSLPFNRRVAAFTRLLCSRKEQAIAVVGHCRFFMKFLGIPKPDNVDVIRCQFDRESGKVISAKKICGYKDE